MRNPNGYGSVYKLSGNRRRPYAARITVGFKTDYTKSKSYPVYKFIGYYKTRAEAMRALALYNGDNESHKATLSEVYELWRQEHEPTVKSFKQYSSAMRAFDPLMKKPIDQITIRDIEDVGTASGKSKVVLSKGKQALVAIYSFAFRKGYIDESKATMPTFVKFTAAKEAAPKTKHRAFTHEEITTLWKYKEDPAVQVILFMIYSGVRISELSEIKNEDVHLSERYFEIRKSKTEAGRRKVPIHDRVLFIAKAWNAQKGLYFAPIKSDYYSVDTFRRNVFEPKCEEIIGTLHLPHDTRYTTATLLTEAGVDIRYIKLILGHAQQDVTNAVYAKKISIGVLLEAINQI